MSDLQGHRPLDKRMQLRYPCSGPKRKNEQNPTCSNSNSRPTRSNQPTPNPTCHRTYPINPTTGISETTTEKGASGNPRCKKGDPERHPTTSTPENSYCATSSKNSQREGYHSAVKEG